MNMKRRLLSLLLTVSVLCSLALPAFAAQSTDERLAAVTLKVKGTLGLDTQDYTDFYGQVSEELLAPTWYLDWRGEQDTLSISATEQGKILSYHRSSYTSAPYTGTFSPSFPAGDLDSARAAAQAFLKKVLTAGESFTMEERGNNSLSATTYRFGGEILLNGLSAGLTYSISLRCEDNAVTSFYRDDLNGRVMGEIPSAEPAIPPRQAASLRSTLSMRLEYVRSESDPIYAILRYLPEYSDEYYVDAMTGELVNLSQLTRELEKGMDAVGGKGESSNDTMVSAPAAPAPAPTLTPTEQAGVEKLEGVLSRDALDNKARAVKQLGLDSYTLSSVNYNVSREKDDDTVTATLIYGKQVEGLSWRRTLTLDARTGALQSLYSSGSMPEAGVERTVDVAAAEQIARDFLKVQCPAQYGKTQANGSSDAASNERRIFHSFTFTQQENGYFFPDNAISVGVDSTDGSISSFSMHFDDSVTFQNPQGILTMDQAIDAWMNTYTVKLGYIMVPTALDYAKPEYRPLMDYGIGYLYRLVLGYQLTREDYLLGIDAMTGAPVAPSWQTEERTISYTDLSGHWAQDKLERLAKYGVGYWEPQFRPDQGATQLDLIALMASTRGYRYDPAGENAADQLYQYAYDLGIIAKGERSDTTVLTRSAAVKLILDALGYSSVAQLQGIFRTKFADDSAIPAAHYGYVALGQGLGMLSGNPDGTFSPNAQVTRAQAAVMLYLLMDR